MKKGNHLPSNRKTLVFALPDCTRLPFLGPRQEPTFAVEAIEGELLTHDMLMSIGRGATPQRRRDFISELKHSGAERQDPCMEAITEYDTSETKDF